MPPCPSGADAIQRLGEDPRQRRLADATRPGEQVGVVQPPRVERMRERAHDVVLPDGRGEIARTPLAGEHLIRHANDSSDARSVGRGRRAAPTRRRSRDRCASRAAVRAERPVEVDRRLVPVEHRPLETSAAAAHRELREMQHQRLAMAAAACGRLDEQVLEIQAAPRQKGREVVEIEREADRVLVFPSPTGTRSPAARRTVPRAAAPRFR